MTSENELPLCFPKLCRGPGVVLTISVFFFAGFSSTWCQGWGRRVTMRCLSEGGPEDQGRLLRMKTVRTTSFHVGRRCQYLTEHQFLFFGSFLSYSLSSQDKVCPVGGFALHPHSAAPVKHIRTMPAGGDTFPHLKPELTFSVFWSKTVLGVG